MLKVFKLCLKRLLNETTTTTTKYACNNLNKLENKLNNTTDNCYGI